MGYSKLYYALLDLKKVVIFTCFNVTIYIEFDLFNYSFVYFVNYIFLIKNFYFLGKFAYLLLVYAKKLFFLFLKIGFIVISLHNLNTKQH
jgi:hypothetical protein